MPRSCAADAIASISAAVRSVNDDRRAVGP
jgi:hypothetical protein